MADLLLSSMEYDMNAYEYQPFVKKYVVDWDPVVHLNWWSWYNIIAYDTIPVKIIVRGRSFYDMTSDGLASVLPATSGLFY